MRVSSAPRSFTSLRKDVDWGERADDWMCQSTAAIDLAEREMVPACAVASAGGCEDRFGGSHAVLTQVLPAVLPSGPLTSSMPRTHANSAGCAPTVILQHQIQSE